MSSASARIKDRIFFMKVSSMLFFESDQLRPGF